MVLPKILLSTCDQFEVPTCDGLFRQLNSSEIGGPRKPTFVGPLRSESKKPYSQNFQPFPTDPSARSLGMSLVGAGKVFRFQLLYVCLCTAVSLDRGWSRTCHSDAKYATLNSRGQNQKKKNAIKQNKVALNKNKKIRATTQYRLHRCTGDSLL